MKKRGKRRKLLYGSLSVASVFSLLAVAIGPSIFIDSNQSSTKKSDTPKWDIIVPDNYESIQKAINNANEGDRIFVRNGTYNGIKKIDIKNLTIQGENNESTIINARDSSAVYIEADSINFSGFSLINNGVNESLITVNSNGCSIFDNILIVDDIYDGTEYGIRLAYGSENNFSNNRITGADIAIQIQSSTYNLFLNNTIEGNQDGINILGFSPIRPTIQITNQYCIGNVIRDNLIKNNDEGIYIYSSKENYILNNTIVNNRWSGVSLYKSSNLIIKNNEFVGAGLEIGGDDISYYVHEIEGNKVNNKSLYYFNQKNQFTVPSDAGQIIIVDCTDVIIQKTIISGASTAVLVAFSRNVEINGNEFSSNYRGVSLFYSLRCSVKQNNFINNTFDAAFVVLGFFNRKSNTWNRNFWDNRIGNKRFFTGLLPKLIPGRFHLNTRFKVLDKLGLGFRTRNFDRNPAKTPYKI